MEVEDVVERHAVVLRRLAADPSTLPGADRVALVRDLQDLRTWADARETELLSVIHRERDDVNAGARDLTQLAQQEARVGYGEAKRRDLRATWTDELPRLRQALLTGTHSTPQVDEICLLAERLAPDDRQTLRVELGHLLDEVADLTPARTRARLRAFESSLESDDGAKRLQKQRQANSLRLPRQSDGTRRLSGQLDPVSAEFVTNALDAKVTDMWRREGKGRDHMDPPDRVMTNEQRRAAALVELIRAGAAADPGTRGRAEIVVLIDHQTLMGQLSVSPTVKLGSGEPIPAAEARRLACDAGIIPVVLGGSSRPLNVGRAARGATPAQRTALRAVHDTCCVANCDVAFDHCQIHHITWWRHGGRSDIDNLAPVCTKHHHLIHDDLWELTLDTDRIGHLHRRESPAAAPSPPPAAMPPRQRTTATRPTRSPRTAPTPSGRAPDHVRPMRC